MTANTYWLLDEDEALVAAAMKRISNYAERMQTSGRVDVWGRASRAHFSRDWDSGLDARSVQIGGAQGEMIGTRDNQVGCLSRQVGIMVTGSRPSYSTRSIGSSSAGIQVAAAGDKLCDFMISKRGAEEAAKRAETYMRMYGMGWFGATWDPTAGKYLGEDESGRPRYLGNILFVAKRPDEVVYDVDLDETSEHQWLMVARQVNRWHLAKLHPKAAEHIMSADTYTPLEKIRNTLRLSGSKERKTNGDLITVYDIYEPPSCIMPKGFYGTILGSKLIVRAPAMYDDFAHYPMIAECEPGTKNGHSYLWDLLGLQQVNDAALSALITIVENLGDVTLHLPTGTDLDTTKDALEQPFRVTRGDQPPVMVGLDPGLISALTTAKGIYVDSMVTVSGLNDVARGDAGKSQSGEALQTMHTLAQQSVSPLQSAYSTGFGLGMSGGVRVFARHASVEAIVEITGIGNTDDAIAFKKALGAVDNIDTEMGPAELRHSSGKRAFADKMWSSGAITNPEEYREAMATGKIEPMLARPQSQRKLIEQENEALRAGKPVTVLDTDDHRLHIQQHAIVGDDLALRAPQLGADGQPVMVPELDEAGNPVLDEMGAAVLRPQAHPTLEQLSAHIRAHIDAIRKMDPDLASALSTEPVPGQVMAQQMQPPVPPAADPNAAPTPDPNAAPGANPNEPMPIETTASGVPMTAAQPPTMTPPTA